MKFVLDLTKEHNKNYFLECFKAFQEDEKVEILGCNSDRDKILVEMSSEHGAKYSLFFNLCEVALFYPIELGWEKYIK